MPDQPTKRCVISCVHVMRQCATAPGATSTISLHAAAQLHYYDGLDAVHRRWLARLNFEQAYIKLFWKIVSHVEAGCTARRLETDIEALLPDGLSQRWLKHCKACAACDLSPQSPL